jgi:hypothetical protein
MMSYKFTDVSGEATVTRKLHAWETYILWEI